VGCGGVHPLGMTARERLHQLVEDLDQEHLVARWDEVLFLASDWEPDERPLTPAEEAAVREGCADLAAGRTASLDEPAVRQAKVRDRVAASGLVVRQALEVLAGG
jgi:hypothetical protein